MAVRQYKPALFRTVAGAAAFIVFSLSLASLERRLWLILSWTLAYASSQMGNRRGDAGEPNHSFTLAVGQVIESADGLVIERRFNVNAR